MRLLKIVMIAAVFSLGFTTASYASLGKLSKDLIPAHGTHCSKSDTAIKDQPEDHLKKQDLKEGRAYTSVDQTLKSARHAN